MRGKHRPLRHKVGAVVLGQRGLFAVAREHPAPAGGIYLYDVAALEGQGDQFMQPAHALRQVIRPTPEHAAEARRRTR